MARSTENPSIETLRDMSAHEIVCWCINNSRPKLGCQRLAIAITPYRPDYKAEGSPTISSRQIWQMQNGVFSRHLEAPHHIAFIRYFFPDDQAAQRIFLEKIQERIGKNEQVSSPISSTQHKIRVMLAVQAPLIKILGIMPEDHQALVAASADVKDPTRSLVDVIGRTKEVRRAIKEILASLDEGVVIIKYTETHLDGCASLT